MSNKTWKTKNGRKIPIEQMTEVHLWNSITMLRRRIKTGAYLIGHLCESFDALDGPCYECQKNDMTRAVLEVWIENLQVELKRRGMSPEPIWDVLEKKRP